MNTAPERDNARLRQMQKLIHDYERALISQDLLLQELDTLLTSLETIDPAWSKAFKSEWWTIEQVYAASKEPDLRLPADRAATVVSGTLGNMRALLFSAIGTS